MEGGPVGGELPLAGFHVGVTAARKAEEQVEMLERRGAKVTWAPALSADPNRVDEVALREATQRVLDGPIDIFIATTGVGMKAWFEAAEDWGLLDRLVEVIGGAEILARGPKSVGALRARGLRELWTPESEEFDDVLRHLRGRDLAGRRIVVQEHGQRAFEFPRTPIGQGFLALRVSQHGGGVESAGGFHALRTSGGG